MNSPHEGIVYTETTVYSPPAQYAADAPYQLAIIDAHDDATSSAIRITVRILADTPDERVHIGDRVTFAENRDGVLYFRKASTG